MREIGREIIETMSPEVSGSVSIVLGHPGDQIVHERRPQRQTVTSRYPRTDPGYDVLGIRTQTGLQPLDAFSKTLKRYQLLEYGFHVSLILVGGVLSDVPLYERVGGCSSGGMLASL